MLQSSVPCTSVIQTTQTSHNETLFVMATLASFLAMKINANDQNPGTCVGGICLHFSQHSVYQLKYMFQDMFMMIHAIWQTWFTHHKLFSPPYINRPLVLSSCGGSFFPPIITTSNTYRRYTCWPAVGYTTNCPQEGIAACVSSGYSSYTWSISLSKPISLKCINNGEPWP